jgi:hypothetical protein
MIYAGMAMLPDRFPESLLSVQSILPQVDRLFLCLNGFDSIPEELVHEKVEVWHYGKNLGDRGKFFWPFGNYRAFLTLDDDLIYPSTYVADFVATSELFRDVILTHHGKIVPDRVRDYWTDCKNVVHCLRRNDENVRVDIPGTGVAYYPQDIYKQFQPNHDWNRADLYVYGQMKRLDVRAYALRHPADYFGYIAPPKGTTIWEQTQAADMTAIFHTYE